MRDAESRVADSTQRVAASRRFLGGLLDRDAASLDADGAGALSGPTRRLALLGVVAVALLAFLAIPAFAAAETLDVSKTGTGSGTVTSSPAGIDCGADCTEVYTTGEMVTLTATATSGSVFTGWSGGGCSGTDPCQVTLDSDLVVTAQFTATWMLNVTVDGNGAGSVTTHQFGTNCEEDDDDCGITVDETNGPDPSETYLDQTLVTLTAVEDAVSTLPVVWTGCDNVTVDNKCEVTMDAVKNVTATFTLQTRFLAVGVGGAGVGVVVSEPAGDIDCDITNAPDCAEDYDHGTTIILVATPGNVNTQPAVWSGCTQILIFNRCRVTMAGDQNVTATFNLSPRHLAVTVAGSGAATVISSPVGISCNEANAPDCDEGYPHGTAVTLTATEAPNATKAQWSGCDNVTPANECEVTMDHAKSVTASVTRIDKVISPRTPGECEDGLDNDGDGFIDYPVDPGCASTADDEPGDPPDSGIFDRTPAPSSLLRAAGFASVRGNTAQLRARCVGSKACKGTAKLFAHRVLIARAHYSLAAGKSEVLHLRLNGRGMDLLDSAGGRVLKATLSGTGLRSRVVRLKAAGNAKRAQARAGGRR